jgi:hypothetical protein
MGDVMGPARLVALGSTIVLLAASGTAAAAQTSTEDEALLPGVPLATEQVEPGVVKVTSDGVRDLSATSAACVMAATTRPNA